MIVYFVDEASVPSEFISSEWPLHITLLANFTINRPLDDLKTMLRDYCRQINPFNISVEGEALFGAKQNVAVSLMQPNQNIVTMHQTLADITASLGADFDEPAYMGKGYRPHATIQTSSRLVDNQTVNLNSITLVDMFPNQDMNRRRVIETYGLTTK